MRRWSLAIAIVALGCAAPIVSRETPPGPTPSPNLARLADVPPPGYLVWTGGVDGETVWLDANGTERGRAAGVVIALRAGLWKLRIRDEHAQVATCTAARGQPGPRGDGSGTAAAAIHELVALAPGDETIALHSSWWSRHGSAGTDHRAELTGQLGRFVFLTERTETETCQTEPSRSVVGRTFDLVRGYPTEPLIDGYTEDRLRAVARVALIAKLAGAGDPATGDAWLGATRPVWREGELGLDHLFWMATCPACSDGEWSIATYATWVAATAIPGVLLDLAEELPAPVRARLSSAPAPVGVTWGYPDDGWPAAFAR